MIPDPETQGLDYSVLCKEAGKESYKALSAAVIYGANASGKTSLIAAMQTFRTIVLQGNIINPQRAVGMDAADCKLELIPNCTLDAARPVKFAAKFIHGELLIEYSIELDLGRFLDTAYNRSVVAESLLLNNELVFERRKDDLTFGNEDAFSGYMLASAKENLEVSKKIAREGLNPIELFLANGFKNAVSNSLAASVQGYFGALFQVHCHADRINIAPFIPPRLEETWIEDKALNSVAEVFGINSNRLLFKKKKNMPIPVLYSQIGQAKHAKTISSKLFESYGTQRFVNMVYPAVLAALKTGGALVADELDASIHPMAILSLISIFHNDEINKHGAQLIFNTHNPLYLNGNVLRRDEIKFVERDDKTTCSSHYSLSDFGTNARNGEDYMKNYFVSKYGAIKDIDLSDVFREIMGVKP